MENLNIDNVITDNEPIFLIDRPSVKPCDVIRRHVETREINTIFAYLCAISVFVNRNACQST